VYPEEVESLYGRSPFIERIGVTKMETNGREEVFAFIVPKHENGDRRKRADGDDIQAKIREEISRISLEISPHKRITRFQICDHDLLCTRLGKVKRHELAALAKKEEVQERRFMAPSPPSGEPGKVSEYIIAFLRKRLARTTSFDMKSHLELDLGIDSLGRTELIASLEALFRLSVPDDEVVKLQTVGDLVEMIQAHADFIPDLSEAFGPSSNEDDTIPVRLDISRQGQEKRLKWIVEKTGVNLEYLSRAPFDPALLKGNVEHFIGMAQVPVGLAGPLSLSGEAAQGTFYVPMATTEGALIASVTRGMMAITRSGGARSRVLETKSCGPRSFFSIETTGGAFYRMVESPFDRIKPSLNPTTRNGN
jgi:acyl carrier protein